MAHLMKWLNQFNPRFVSLIYISFMAFFICGCPKDEEVQDKEGASPAAIVNAQKLVLPEEKKPFACPSVEDMRMQVFNECNKDGAIKDGANKGLLYEDNIAPYCVFELSSLVEKQFEDHPNCGKNRCASDNSDGCINAKLMTCIVNREHHGPFGCSMGFDKFRCPSLKRYKVGRELHSSYLGRGAVRSPHGTGLPQLTWIGAKAAGQLMCKDESIMKMAFDTWEKIGESECNKLRNCNHLSPDEIKDISQIRNCGVVLEAVEICEKINMVDTSWKRKKKKKQKMEDLPSPSARIIAKKYNANSKQKKGTNISIAEDYADEVDKCVGSLKEGKLNDRKKYNEKANFINIYQSYLEKIKENLRTLSKEKKISSADTGICAKKYDTELSASLNSGPISNYGSNPSFDNL
jgi:hypothetical protein